MIALGISDPSTVPSTSPNAKAVPAKASVALSILCASKNSARRTWLPLGQLCLFFSEMPKKKTEMKIGEGGNLCELAVFEFSSLFEKLLEMKRVI